MATSSKHWIFPKAAPTPYLKHFRDLHPVLAHILYNYGFETPGDALTFLASRSTHDPLDQKQGLKGVKEAAYRLLEAIKRQERITIYGDFDADGVTSTALMVEVLRNLRANVDYYIPNRVDEGYGLNGEALRKLAQQGTRVVVTVDCGIRSIDEVEEGKQAGLEMIVTDHHSIGPEVPIALSVINPKQIDCTYPEKMLAGVGVAYKLASSLYRLALGAHPTKEGYRRLDERLRQLLDLVAIGTVADLAPLSSPENRALVRRGLEVLNEARRPGVKALLEVAGVLPGQVTAMTIGFAIGPRINAAGRLDDAKKAVEMLLTDNPVQAGELARELNALNTRRQELTRSAQDLIRDQVSEVQDLPLIFAGDKAFQPGIVGLVAGRLVEEFYRPAVVMEIGDHESRASCRSIPQFDITQALDQCADLLVRHGGHAQAAGFTVLNDNIDALLNRLTDLARIGLAGQELRPTLIIHAEVDVNQVSDELLEALHFLEPTGHNNPAPVLMSRAVYVLESRLVGKEGKHLKLRIARAGKPPLDAIAFGLGEWAALLPGHVDVAYQLEINEWNGKQTLQLNVQDIRPASAQR